MIRATTIALCLLASCSAPSSSTPPSGTGKAPLTQAGRAIVETMNAGGYTYAKLGSERGPVWYAVPECEVAVGNRVEVSGEEMRMQNFKSPTLDRTFAVIYFASGLEIVDGAEG